MPIRKENRDRYPKDWPAISARVRKRARNRCEECGVKNYAIGARAPDGTFLKNRPRGEKMLGLDWPPPGEDAWFKWKGEDMMLRVVRIVLTVAHLDHQPENCADENLRAWCQRCHNRYDASERRRGIKMRLRATMAAGDLFT
jgi:5-methylcytosine-specific restriction endonuclease McrA